MDVADWLKGLGLERYEPAFRKNRIDSNLLSRLTAEDLKDIGVTLVGDRRRLLDAIDALRDHGGPGEAPGGSSPTPRPTTTDAERRQITVLFCDLVDSTALATQLDPEDLRTIITAFQRTVAQTITHYEGFVAKYMGDGVLVYFGYPRAQEHDAERAVGAGLALVGAAGAIEAPSRLMLRLRVGIATGLVVIGDLIGSGSAREEAVVGEPPNLAARLQSLAEPDTVLICPTTRRLVGNLFEYRDLGPIELKGFAAPIPVWQVVRDSSVAGRFEALRASSLTPLVGREEELELLLRRWERTKAGTGQVVLISGEPGLGKSRVIVALQDRLKAEEQIRLRYFCSPHHSDTALYPFANQLEHAAGIGRDDTPGSKLDKLRRLLTRSEASPEEFALLADLLSLPVSDDIQAAGIGTEHGKERTFRAIVHHIERLAARKPVFMVFEDAHWSDPSSVELLNDIIERLQVFSVLLIVTFRPEFRLQWGSEPHIFTLILSRLDAQHTGEFAQRVAGDKALPAAIVDQIVKRTDGVPLFIEELTRTLLESGVLQNQGNRYSLNRPLPSVPIPSSLQASLLARLDRLPPTREIAQIGAAIGREFSHRLLSLVADCSEAALHIAVDRLIDAGLVSRRGVPPAATYAFKHALVQDVAYGTLLRAARQMLHARIAAVLEQDFAVSRKRSRSCWLITTPKLRHRTKRRCIGSRPAVITRAARLTWKRRDYSNGP
jgi:class 3 adenylate cyclase